MVAIDDDSTGNFAIGGYTTPGDQDRIDGLTYTLTGEGADTMFDIVPATGQILTIDKLDYETKKSYKVTVTATDPDGANDSIVVTINVTDVDEAPVSGLLTLTGDDARSHPENSRATWGRYIVSGTSGAFTWMLEGADKDYFSLSGESDDRSRMLQFKPAPAEAPDYEMPRGQAMSATTPTPTWSPSRSRPATRRRWWKSPSPSPTWRSRER